MSYVIYDKVSTQLLRIFRNGFWQDACFATESAAKAGLTRAVNKDGEALREQYVITSVEEFSKIEKMKEVRNLMSGEMIRIPVNTPRSCDPSTELYWSM
jgi:hypothetical protein